MSSFDRRSILFEFFALSFEVDVLSIKGLFVYRLNLVLSVLHVLEVVQHHCDDQVQHEVTAH